MDRGRKMRRGVKVPPYVVPTTRRVPQPSPFMVPTRWVKFFVAIFLLPLCAILTQTFFTVFARLVLLVRRGALVDRVHRSAAPDFTLRVWP
ncbi:MAG: hypothetical protein DMF29_08840 [Verrucomicrobia bacterium]|nr:MAG: hypothetical protein DMF29_08840 [Verrucomicrobiota bacterium]